MSEKYKEYTLEVNKSGKAKHAPELKHDEFDAIIAEESIRLTQENEKTAPTSRAALPSQL